MYLFDSEKGRISFLRVTTLVVGAMMVSGSGPVIGFNAYANSLKSTFNFTQSDVEFCGSMINLGHKMGFPAGVLHEYIGSRILSGGAATTSFTAWILLSFSAVYHHSYQDKAWLLGIYFFFAGFGAICAFMSAVPINFNNFSLAKRGRIVACLEGCFSLAPSFIAVIYGYGFYSGYGIYPDLDNLKGFFFLQACSWPLIFLLGVFLLREYPPEPEVEDTENAILVKDKSDARTFGESLELSISVFAAPPRMSFPKHMSESLIEAIRKSSHGSIWGKEILRDTDFLLFLASFMIFASIQTLYLNNLTSILVSYEFFQYNQLFTVLAPLLTTLGLVITGNLSDKFIDYVPRYSSMVIAHCLQTLGYLTLLLFGHSLSAQFFVLWAIETSAGIMYCTCPTILSETYGVYYFGRNWGGCLIGAALCCLSFQSIYGYFYDALLVDSPSDIYCFGKMCFRNTFIICLLIMLVCIVLDFFLLKRHIKRYSQYDKVNTVDVNSNN